MIQMQLTPRVCLRTDVKLIMTTVDNINRLNPFVCKKTPNIFVRHSDEESVDKCTLINTQY